MKKGDFIHTPRFSRVEITKVFKNEGNARQAGFTEPTHYRDWKYGVLGKHTGPDTMIFAGYRKNANRV